MILGRRTTALLVACGALSGSACGGGDGDGDGNESTDKPTAALVATTSVWADIVSHVACNEPVPTLIPSGADPHSFEPSLRDRQMLDDATVIIANGGDLEGLALELLDAAASGGTEVVEMMPLASPIGDDPHVWQDPIRVLDTIDAIAAAAVTAGHDQADVAKCASSYRAELAALDAEIASLLAPLADDDRLIVTSHDSLGYFADRYNLEIVGTVIPSTNTLAESNAADLAQLADTIEELGVTAVFTERLESSSDANRLAERLGVGVVPLVTDAVTDDPASDTYVEMMRSNGSTIAEASAP